MKLNEKIEKIEKENKNFERYKHLPFRTLVVDLSQHRLDSGSAIIQ